MRRTPCPEWKAVDVVGHLVQGLGMASSLATTGAVGSFAPTRDAAGADPKASFAAARSAAEATFTPENLDKVVQSPFGEMPVDQFLGVITLDVITHTWDLGRAIGHEVALEPDLVHDCFENVKPRRDPPAAEPLRTEGRPAAGADEQAQLMAFLGRNV
jgi:uncharacterized protein (TIGR03086 family)